MLASLGGFWGCLYICTSVVTWDVPVKVLGWERGLPNGGSKWWYGKVVLYLLDLVVLRLRRRDGNVAFHIRCRFFLGLVVVQLSCCIGQVSLSISC